MWLRLSEKGDSHLCKLPTRAFFMGPTSEIMDCTAGNGPLLNNLYIFSCSDCFLASLALVTMGDLKHLVVAKFKEGVVVEEIIQGMEKLVREIDAVKSFEWGLDTGSEEMLRQGFTHVFVLTFRSAEDFTAFLGHPLHVEFSATFSAAIEKILLLDYPAVVAKAPAA